jgi:3-isopropylmalate dehydratase small subunit
LGVGVSCVFALSFEIIFWVNCEVFKYLGTLSNPSVIHEEIEEQIQSGECLLPFNSESFVFPSPL